MQCVQYSNAWRPGREADLTSGMYVKDPQCEKSFAPSCLNETKVHILHLFVLNHEIFHVYTL